ncbi:MAG: sigma-70 family RNA polymerase sigma factor [Wenzhouxiangellaceae bacterium]|nr:MAG: sigma-70 family RNA polymerase sigma factor [Wenzhouxiangellaceae bacterium]
MDITELLQAAADGDRDAGEQVYAVVYEQLREAALRQRLGWYGDETLNTTALVNEAWLKLAEGQRPRWQSRGHFLAVASTVMRQLLVDRSRQRRALKRGGDAVLVEFDESGTGDQHALSDDLAEDILQVHEALNRLSRTHPRQVKVIECRFFGGLKVEETSQALNISISTVRRDWELSKLWLHRELGRE